MSDNNLTINLNRGLKGMAEKVLSRLPHGETALNAGLRNVLHRMIDQTSEIPKNDFTLEGLAERIGIIAPEPKLRLRKGKKRA